MTMTRRGHLQAMTAVFGLATASQALAADPPLYGTWTGILDAGNMLLTLRLVIDAKGVTIFSPDQSNVGIPGSDVIVDGERLKIVFKPISATFEGVLSDERHIDGVFTQGRPIRMRLVRGEVAEDPPEQVWPALTSEFLEAKRASVGTPAMAAAWARGSHSTVMVAGSRSSEARVPVRSADQWHWGSITKSMTATLCARLAEAGIVRWDMTVAEVLGEDAVEQPVYRKATLLHLLSHRAGLQANIGDEDAKTFSLRLADAREERLRYARLALAQKPVAPLGAAQVYSNNGYVVVGAMLEKLMGKPWETLIQTEVFEPLGVKNAGQGAPGTRGKVVQPIGHAVENGKRIPHPLGGPDDDNVAALGPAGRVHMPMADMLTYLAAHRDRPTAFLKSATWETLHTPHFGDNYALGWFTRKDRRLFHGGSNTLWVGLVIVDPKTGVVSAACANDAAPQTQAAVEEMALTARAAALA
jgi:CubicO group peptidase (beta-lactamase class C family)